MSFQHTYRIRHKGVESTPHNLAELRHMWKAGKIDSTTEFKRGDSPVWLDADDLWAELHLDETGPGTKSTIGVATLHPGSVRPGAARDTIPLTPTPVRLVSARLPFREVFVLVFKFYAAALLWVLVASVAWLALKRFLP